jgi:hypothetical protein
MRDMCPSGLDEIRTYRPYRPLGLKSPTQGPGFQYAGLTCCVIARYSVFAIEGRLPLSRSCYVIPR